MATSHVDPDKFAAAAARFTAFFNELNRAFVEREDLLMQVALGLLAREHVLMTGPPGTAKSGVASAVLGRIVDEKTGKSSLFARQFTESTVQTDLVGPINFKTLMDTGRTEHFTDEGMLGAVHAFLDEVLDGRDMLLRSALNVLQERELKEGTKVTRGQIECAVMTTNRYLAEVLEGSRETLLAFVDRVAFVSFVPKGFANPSNLTAVLRRQVGAGARPEFESSLTIQDLDTLQDAADSVHVSDGACEALTQFLHALDAEMAAAVRADQAFIATRYLSTRTAVRAARVLRAVVVFDKLFRSPQRSLEVMQQDFAWLRLHLILSGPSPEGIEQLLKREGDPRERRQLMIARTEREIFDRCLGKVPPIAAASPPRPSIDVARLKKDVAKAIPAQDSAQLVSATRALAAAADGHGAGADEAQRMLAETVRALTDRALRAGITAGALPDRPVDDAVAELSSLADALEQTASSARPTARWLRGRAIALVEEAASLAPSGAASDFDALLGEEATGDGLALRAEQRVGRLEALGAARTRLRAQGADVADKTASDEAWKGAVSRAEEELVVVWDIAFRRTVSVVLSQTPADRLADVLQRLAPAFQRIDALGARLTALGGAVSSLKARVVGPRIRPLIASVFERLDARDRTRLVSEFEGLLGVLEKAGLSAVVAPRDLVGWSAEAVVRADRRRAEPPRGKHDYDGYRRLRAAEERVPITYTLVEVALRASPNTTRDPGSPGQAVSAIASLIAEVPETTRADIGELELARITRALHHLEQWWQSLAGPNDATPEALDEPEAARRLEAIALSSFFRVTRDEAALARFALEARLMGEMFPEQSQAAAAVRERLDALEARSGGFVNALLRTRADAAWAGVLAAPRRDAGA